MRIGRLVALAAAATLACAVAVAALADRPRIHFTAAGQAAARAALVKRADLGPAPGWKAKTEKPDLTSSLPCSYQPKQSDLVVNGAAETLWQNTGIQIDSEAEVLQTAGMVRLDWQRSVVAPQMVPCLQHALAKQFGSSGNLASFKRIPFPQVAAYTRAYRAIVDVKTSSGTVPVMIDAVLIGRDRTEITLATTAPLASARAVEPAERRLAALVASRA